MSKFELIDPIQGGIEKNMEISKKLTNNVRPILEQQERLSELTHPLKEVSAQCQSIVEPLSFSLPALEKISDIQKSRVSMQLSTSLTVIDAMRSSLEITASKIASLYYEIPISQTLKSMSDTISASRALLAQNILTNFSSTFLEAVQSPFLQWLKNFDFSPWKRILENWKIPNSSDYHDELDAIYLRAMYAAKWFPYAGWMASMELFTTVNGILSSSRGMSKRCEKRIDKAVLSYYTTAEIKRIKKEWNASELDSHIKKALGQTLEAYLRREYALVIPFLATMWEGIIKSKTAGITRTPKENFKKLVDENGFDDVFSDFYNNFIIKTCYSKDDVIEGIPNRHSIAHSWYVKYPTKKAALNAIILTDFVINLKPSEEKKSTNA